MIGKIGRTTMKHYSNKLNVRHKVTELNEKKILVYRQNDAECALV